MPPLLSEAEGEAGGRSRAGAEPLRRALERAGPEATGTRPLRDPSGARALHLSKLRGITDRVRARLKRHGVTDTDQLLEAAGWRSRRLQLAERSGIETRLLGRLACRTDLIRIKSIGAIFADMLELLGVDRSVGLARQDAARLHHALLELNAAERFARRAPTLEEVRLWIVQARSLPQLVDDDG